MVSVCPWTWGMSSHLLQQSAAAAPYIGWGVSPYSHTSWLWTWSSSSRPSCACAATALWAWGSSSRLLPQNLRYSVKAVLRGRFIAIQSYLKKQEKSQINNLTLHLKQLEKEEMKNPRVSRRKEIIKIREEINEKETKETIAKSTKLKADSLRRWIK